MQVEHEKNGNENENMAGPNLLTQLIQEGAEHLKAIYHRTI